MNRLTIDNQSQLLPIDDNDNMVILTGVEVSTRI